MTTPASVSIVALRGMPLVSRGDDLAHLITNAAAAQGELLGDGTVVIVAQKIVSKAEGRMVRLAEVTPSARATELAAATHKDPRFVQVVLDESKEVLRSGRDVLIVESRQGFICANAGVDRSNAGSDDDQVLLLPHDADASAAALRAGLRQLTGADVAVIISDTHGRAFRMGAVGVAIGVAGIEALRDLRGQRDLFGYEMRVSDMGAADEIASAASLVMGQCAEGTPVVLLHGLSFQPSDAGVRTLLRAPDLDLFR